MKDTREWLQKEFEYFEAEPPMDLWPEIEARMQEEKASKKRWLPYFSIAASILVLFGIFWSLRLVDRKPSATIAEGQQIETSTPVTPELPNVAKEATIAEASSTKEETDNEGINTNSVKMNIIKQETENIASEKRMNQQAQLVADNQIGNEDPKKTISLESIEETERISYTLSNIDHHQSNVAIRTSNTYEDHILNEASMIPTRSPERIERVGSTNKLDLNDLTLEDAVTFASNGLNKIVNTPIEIKQEDAGGETVKTYSFKLGNFSITKKQHVKTTKTDRS